MTIAKGLKLALLLMAFGADNARAQPATMGPVTGNRGIVTQNQTGDNYQLNLVAYHGVATLSPESSDKCKPQSQPVLIAGSDRFSFTYSPFVAIEIGGKPALELEQSGNTITIKELKIVDNDGHPLAFVEGKKISYLSGAKEPAQTANSFVMYDLDGDEVLNLHYTSECVIELSGIFNFKKFRLTISPDQLRVDGAKASNITFRDLGFIDIAIKLNEDGSMALGRPSINP